MITVHEKIQKGNTLKSKNHFLEGSAVFLEGSAAISPAFCFLWFHFITGWWFQIFFTYLGK